FDVLAAFGHAEVMDTVLAGIESDNPRDAVAAGAAFSRITGFDVAGPQPVTLPPEEGSVTDEFQKEFLDEVLPPSAELANRRWKDAKARFAGAVRWRWGKDLSGEVPVGLLSDLDMESRWESCLRAKFHGFSLCNPVDLEAFPQARRLQLAPR